MSDNLKVPTSPTSNSKKRLITFLLIANVLVLAVILFFLFKIKTKQKITFHNQLQNSPLIFQSNPQLEKLIEQTNSDAYAEVYLTRFDFQNIEYPTSLDTGFNQYFYTTDYSQEKAILKFAVRDSITNTKEFNDIFVIYLLAMLKYESTLDYDSLPTPATQIKDYNQHVNNYTREIDFQLPTVISRK